MPYSNRVYYKMLFQNNPKEWQVEQEILNKLSIAFNVDLLEKTRFSLEEYDEKQLIDIMIKNKFTYWKYADVKVVDGQKQHKKYLVVFKGRKSGN
jgi:hypothetical protein